MKLLHGDGIFFADPIRAVILDGDGKLLAVSPMSTALFVACDYEEGFSRKCNVYDELRHLVFTPDRASWKATELLEVSGKPQKYPSYNMEEYGFSKRKASVIEIVKYEALSIAASPFLTVVALVWWFVIGWLICPLYWRLKENTWRIREFSFTVFVEVILRLVCISVLVVLAGYGWLLEPYSLPYFIFVSLSGAVLALFITKPKLKTQTSV